MMKKRIEKFLNQIVGLLLLMLVALLPSCDDTGVITNLKLDTYYVGTIDNQDFVIKIEDIDRNELHGEYYQIGNKKEITPVEFEAKLKKNKFIIKTAHQKFVAHQYVWVSDDTAKLIKGETKVDGKNITFRFTEYSKPEFKKFKKRYEEPIYQYEVLKDVRYGTANGYWTSNVTTSSDYFEIIKNGMANSVTMSNLPLTMDIYLPKGDYLAQRPLLMLIHGGGFYIGDKADAPIVRWCTHFASLGYVVASINYRMGFKPAKQSIERCGYRAAQDANAAMRFLLANKATYKIDPNYLFVAGSSAGGITTLNLAFMKNENRPKSSYGNWVLEDLGAVESSGNNIKQNFHIRAVANMWGAVHDINEISNSKTSIISFHGDADQIVPYDYDVPFKDIQLSVSKLFFDKMYGSAAIHRKAKELGYRQALHTFPGSGHAPHVDDNNNPTEKFWYIQKEMTHFFFKEFIPEDIKISSKQTQYYTVNVNNAVQVYWKVDGGLILSAQNNIARVVWFQSATKHKLSVSGYLSNGAVFYSENDF